MKILKINFKFGKLFRALKLAWLFNILTRLLLPTRNLSKRNRRFITGTALLVIFTVVPIIGYTLSHLSNAEAAWFNSNWAFRKSIAITAHTSAETNVYINLTGANAIDTSDATRFQADCGDLRFTDINGKNLPYYIVSGCGTGTTVVHVFFQSMPAGAQTVYYYYGNPSAANGFRTSDFSTEASSYTIGSQGTEEVGVSPIANWKFDEGTGDVANDSSANKNTGAIINNSNFGSGVDGAITISSDTNINSTNSISGRSCADGGDAVNYSSTANTASGSAQIVLSSTPSAGCLKVGDEVLIINLQGASGNTAYVGKYEFKRITAISTATLTLDDNLTNGYDGTTQKIMVQRVPNYSSVTISNSGTDFTPTAWNGTKGGVIAFRASSTVSIASGTTINASGSGYAGGAETASNAVGGKNGDSLIPGQSTTTAANFGGAGGGCAGDNPASGGGGAYGAAGVVGGTKVGTCVTGGVQGASYGTANLSSSMFFGSGGGSGGGNTCCGGRTGAAGGAGGGIIFIGASTLTVTGSIKSNGSDGSSHVCPLGCSAGGGGAGGSIYILAGTATLGSGLVSAPAGAGGTADPTYTADGGAGSVGRVQVTSVTSSGSTGPSAYTSTLTTPTSTIWQAEEQCISGKCIKLPGGISGSVTVAKTVNGVKSVSFWVKPASSSAALIDLNANDASVIATSGTITAPNFTSPTIYVNGKVSSTLTANEWNYVTVTSGTAVTASAINIGNVKGDYLNGFIDEVRFYGYARTAAQVQVDFNTRGGTAGNVLGSSDQNENLSNGLSGYWKMDEFNWANDCVSGVVADSSGGGNKGSACPASTGPTGGAVGKFGRAGDFDGSNDYVFVNNFTKSSSKFTISAWVYADSRPTWGTILKNWGNSSRGEFHFGLESSGGGIGLHIMQNDATEISISEGTAIPLSSWQHVVAVADGRYLHLYRNGVEVTTPVAYDGTLRTTFNCLGIGAKPNDTCTGSDAGSPGFWDGRIDEARIYGRAFSGDEIKQLYNYAPGPVGYYNFDEGNGSIVNDRSGNNNFGTWQGTLGSQWVQGKYGKAGNFNGSDNYVDLGNNSSLDLGREFSVSFWMNNSITGSTWEYYIDRWTYTAGNYRQWSFDNAQGGGGVANRIGFRISSDGTDSGATSIGSTDSSYSSGWHYVTGTWDGATMKLFIDGVLKDSAAKTSMITTSGQNTFIGGADAGGTNPMSGSLDEVKIYNYARTPAQIISDMNASHPAPGSPVGSAVSQWKFDEGYGQVIHNSGNGGASLDGTLGANTTASSDDPNWSLSGKFGKALQFNGSSSYVSTQDKDAFSPSVSPITVSFWAKVPVGASASGDGACGSTGRYMVAKGAASNWEWGFENDNNNLLCLDLFQTSGTAYVTMSSSRTMNDGQWHYYSATIEPGVLAALYVDGQLITSSSSFTGSMGNGTQPVEIGRRGDGNYAIGLIDEVKIYAGVLTASQIKLDYNRGSSQVLGSLSDTSGLTGGSVASNSASAEFCIPGDTSTCNAPVSRWDFEEKSGSFRDTSGNNYSMAPGSTTKYVKGKIGGAIGFDGTGNSGVTAGDVLDLIGSPLTISAWVKPRSFAQYAPIVEKLATGGNYRLVIDDSTGVIGFGIRNSAGTFQGTTSSPYKLSLNTWNHVVVTFDNSTTAKIYLNGVLVATDATFAISRGDTDQEFHFGYNTNNAIALDGDLDQVRIFDYVRTPAQVAWDYNRGAPVGWWKFDECQGSIIHDSSVNGIHGTWSGSGGGTQTAVGTCTTSSTAWGNGATGKFNSSLNFDGTDDYVDIGTNSNLRPTNAVTVSGWLKRTGSLSTNSGIVSVGKNTTNNGGYVMLGTTSNTVRFYIDRTGSASWVFAETNSALTLNQWYYIVGVWDGTTVKMYVDGVLQTTTGSGSTIVYNTGKNDFIGLYGHPVNDHYWTGQMDDVRIYNYALTPSQMRVVMNQGAAIRFGPNTGAP